MELNFNQTTLREKPSSNILVNLLKNLEGSLDFSDSYLYYNLPIYLSSESSFKKTDVLFISKEYGIFIFKCVEDTGRTFDEEILSNSINELMETYSGIFSKFLKSKILRKNPSSLIFDIIPVLFFSNCDPCEISQDFDEWDELLIISTSSLKGTIEKHKIKEPINEEKRNEILALLEGSKGIYTKNERTFHKDSPLTKGKIIDRIENEIAIFDIEQKRAGFNIIDGPQRIRGLAGSGKTVILAMKAAQIHLQQPTAEVVFTYYTRTLHDFIKKLITQFYRQFADVDPNWDKIHIMHAWGGRNVEGLYYKTCIDNGIVPKTWREVSELGKEAFNDICMSLVRKDLSISYDYIIIDEAQDFPTYFYRLCRKITKNNRVIWAYDECQNILDMELQNTVQTFGKDDLGNPYIDFSYNSIEDQDLVLHKCYRNPRKILVSAFALGMGIFSKIVQLPESKELWEDWGFEVNSGDYNTNDLMKITRPSANSPLLKNELLDRTEDIIKFNHFATFEEECSYVVENILGDLSQDLRPEDIIVISLDDRNARKYFKAISRKLAENSIYTFNLFDAPFFSTNFNTKNEITLSSVYKAKGNEAPQVYIVGIDQVFRNKNLPESRNKIFTAMTRAKGWVNITGVGSSAKEFCDEMEKVIENKFELSFKMPDLVKLKVFQRDLELEHAVYNHVDRLLDDLASEMNMPRESVREVMMRKLKEKGGKK